MLLIGVPTAVASASTGADDGDTSTSVEVNGRTFDASDGLSVTVSSYDVKRGSLLPVGQTWGSSGTGITPQATWGTSYATSTETLQLWFTARAKAAGNVYLGKRYVQVCVWYQQGNYVASGTVCSSASSTGSSWIAGGEESVRIMDNLSINWPSTQLYMSVSAINPNVY